MGEVYRAEDLKLGQPATLKFLRRSLVRNAEAFDLGSTSGGGTRRRNIRRAIVAAALLSDTTERLAIAAPPG
jgi:hypothetical protein